MAITPIPGGRFDQIETASYETAASITAWLGPAWDHAELTADELDRFAEAWDAISDRYPREDEQEERTAALVAAVQYLLGETSPDDAGRTLVRARAQLAEALAAARQVAVMAIADGASEYALHERLGVTRRTLRQWLGKPG